MRGCKNPGGLTDEKNNEIFFSYGSSDLYTPQIDMENFSQNEVYIDNVTVYLFSEYSSQRKIAVWNFNNMTFLLDSVLNENDIVNIIKNIC